MYVSTLRHFNHLSDNVPPLNIAHHKSYHPYWQDKFKRVYRDEEDARLKEAQEEGRMMLAASKGKSPDTVVGDLSQMQSPPLAIQQPALTSRHIDLFEVQRPTGCDGRYHSRADPVGINIHRGRSGRSRVMMIVTRSEENKIKLNMLYNTPAGFVTIASVVIFQLFSLSIQRRYGSLEISPLIRESSKCVRAQESIPLKKREMMGSETPRVVHGGTYDDVFGKQDVQDARWRRERHNRG
ncbi:hypothetical protein ONZ45_g3486 [Pleurotus djamor]|nr:hypothetical protein ONZ45_g3486 [Pleurotus djamor]